MIIGVTGNSGSGKSSICKILEKKINAKIIDADKIVKELSKKGNKYYEEIIKYFGTDILLETKEINRKKLAQIIYESELKRENLNKLTRKYVVKEIKRQVENLKKQNIILDVPLLFENNLEKICDKTIAVIANENTKISRICKRDNIEEKIAKERLKIQKDDNFYKEKADFILENNDNKIEDKVIKIIRKLKQ